VVEKGELAVTATLNINFLRRPEPRDVIAEAQLIRCGKRLAYGEVMLFSDGNPEPVAHVTATYALPPQAVPVKIKKTFRTG
jgi:acyl-coenzyme A thioesterase PaaI-like protein